MVPWLALGTMHISKFIITWLDEMFLISWSYGIHNNLQIISKTNTNYLFTKCNNNNICHKVQTDVVRKKPFCDIFRAVQIWLIGLTFLRDSSACFFSNPQLGVTNLRYLLRCGMLMPTQLPVPLPALFPGNMVWLHNYALQLCNHPLYRYCTYYSRVVGLVRYGTWLVVEY
jgi:hypothetical protein